jgi:hypothetical protein
MVCVQLVAQPWWCVSVSGRVRYVCCLFFFSVAEAYVRSAVDPFVFRVKEVGDNTAA